MLFLLIGYLDYNETPIAVYSDYGLAAIDGYNLKLRCLETKPAFSAWCEARWKIVREWRQSGRMANNPLSLPNAEGEKEIETILGPCPSIEGYEYCEVCEVEDRIIIPPSTALEALAVRLYIEMQVLDPSMDGRSEWSEQTEFEKDFYRHCITGLFDRPDLIRAQLALGEASSDEHKQMLTSKVVKMILQWEDGDCSYETAHELAQQILDVIQTSGKEK